MLVFTIIWAILSAVSIMPVSEEFYRALRVLIFWGITFLNFRMLFKTRKIMCIVLLLNAASFVYLFLMMSAPERKWQGLHVGISLSMVALGLYSLLPKNHK
jgi:hypothetical protein